MPASETFKGQCQAMDEDANYDGGIISPPEK